VKNSIEFKIMGTNISVYVNRNEISSFGGRQNEAELAGYSKAPGMDLHLKSGKSYVVDCTPLTLLGVLNCHNATTVFLEE
jgi:hypothetical protein